MLRFSVGLGLVFIDSVALAFEIPKDNDVLPFHWHHICVSSNEDSYTIVVDGQQWYHANHTNESLEKKTVKRLDLGTNNEHWVYSDGINFRGHLSELNIWSKSLSLIQMEQITRNCGKEDPIPDLLNWSELPTSLIRGSKYTENIEKICSHKNATSPIRKIMPYLYDQDDAIHTCQVLKGELAFPNSLNELQKWNGKLLEVVLKNNFIILFYSICIRKCMCSFHSTNEKVIKWIMDKPQQQ